MQVQSGIVKYKDHEIECLKMGRGKKLLIALPGFGQDAHVFQHWLPYLKGEFTLIAINLPGKGRTKWKSSSIRPKDLMAIIQGIRNDFGVERFDLAGYSLGGRICLTIAELQPNWIEHLVLLAPDGLQKNLWYHWATRNVLGKLLFKQIIDKPARWLGRLEWLKKYKLVSEAAFKLAQKTLSDPSKKEELGYIWPLTRYLVPNIPQLRWRLDKYKVRLHIFIGRGDKIILPIQGEKFVKKLSTAHFHLLEQGHRLLVPDVFELVSLVLLDEENL